MPCNLKRVSFAFYCIIMLHGVTLVAAVTRNESPNNVNLLTGNIIYSFEMVMPS